APLSQNMKRERLSDCASADSESRLGRVEEVMSLGPRSQTVPENFFSETEPSGEEGDWTIVGGVRHRFSTRSVFGEKDESSVAPAGGVGHHFHHLWRGWGCAGLTLLLLFLLFLLLPRLLSLVLYLF